MCEAATVSSGAAGAGAAVGVGVGAGAGAAVAAAAERSGGGVTVELEAGSVRSAQELAHTRMSRQDSTGPVFIGAYTYGARRRSCKVFRAPGSGGYNRESLRADAYDPSYRRRPCEPAARQKAPDGCGARSGRCPG